LEKLSLFVKHHSKVENSHLPVAVVATLLTGAVLVGAVISGGAPSRAATAVVPKSPSTLGASVEVQPQLPTSAETPSGGQSPPSANTTSAAALPQVRGQHTPPNPQPPVPPSPNPLPTPVPEPPQPPTCTYEQGAKDNMPCDPMPCNPCTNSYRMCPLNSAYPVRITCSCLYLQKYPHICNPQTE